FRVGGDLTQQPLGLGQVGGRVPLGAEDQGEFQLVARRRGGIVVVLGVGDDLGLLGRLALDEVLQQLQVLPQHQRGGSGRVRRRRRGRSVLARDSGAACRQGHQQR